MSSTLFIETDQAVAMTRFEPIVQIANQQLLSLAVNFELFSPHEYEIEKCQITTSRSLIGFLKKSGLHDYSRQSKASPNKQNIPLLLIKKDKILKIKLSVFRKTDQNGTAAFWPMSNSNFIQANDVCAFINYFNYLILINYSKVSKKYIGQTLNKLGISNEPRKNSAKVPNSVVSDYEQLNFAINSHITSGAYKEKQLYLDFETKLIEQVSSTANVSSETLEKSILSAARNKLNFEHPNPLSDLKKESTIWRRSGYTYYPPSTIFLSALSITAESMSADADFGANNFYDRLITSFEILNSDHQKTLRDNFKTTVDIWEDFNNWLIKTDGQYGFPTAHPIVKHWKYVSYGMSQALIRTGDKKHIKNYLASQTLDPFFNDLYKVLEAHFTSTSAHSYLKAIWAQRHLRPKVIEAALEQLQIINSTNSEEKKLSKLILRLQLKSFPYKSFQPYIIYRQETGLENLIIFDTTESHPAFQKDAKVTLSPIGDGVSVLGPPATLAIDNFLLGNVTLNAANAEGRTFVFRSQPAIALTEVEPSIFEQTNRPEIFKNHILIVRRKYQKNVAEFLKYCADNSFQLIENPKPISPEFIVFKNVTFVRSVSPDEMQGNNDPNYWIRPIETMAEIDIRDGIKLSRNMFHDQSGLELLVSSKNKVFDIKIQIGENQSTISKKIFTKDGIGSIRLHDLAQTEDFFGQDVRIDIGLANYKSTTISFRSSENASPKFDIQPAYDLGTVGYLGSLSVVESVRLNSLISGHRAFELPSVEATGTNLNVNNYSRDFHNAKDNGSYSYLRKPPSKQMECPSRGYHHWLISDGREGLCKDCGERRTFPKLSKLTSNKTKNRPLRPRNNNFYNILKDKSNYSANDIIDSIFFLQDLSWQRFRELCSSISDDLLFANELLRNFAVIGHVDIKLHKQSLRTQRLYASPPVLIRVQDRYLLTGYRSKTLTDKISELVGKPKVFTVGKMWAHLSIEVPSFDSLSVEENRDQIESLVDQLDRPLSIVESSGSNLISALPNLRDIYQNLPEISVAIDGLEKFNATTGAWQPIDSVNTDGGYRQTWPAHDYFIKKRGIFRKATFELSKLFAADLEKMPLHNYSSKNKSFKAKVGCELPILYQRALVSFSGKLPKKSDGAELIFENVPDTTGSILINKIYGQT